MKLGTGLMANQLISDTATMTMMIPIVSPITLLFFICLFCFIVLIVIEMCDYS